MTDNRMNLNDFVTAFTNDGTAQDAAIRSILLPEEESPEQSLTGAQIATRRQRRPRKRVEEETPYLVPENGNGVNPRHPSRLYRGNR